MRYFPIGPVGFAVFAFLLVAAAAAAQDGAATNGAAAETANRIVDKHGIGLTTEQVRIIARSVGGQKEQQLPAGVAPVIGAQVPDSLTLMEMPVEVKDQIGVLRDFKSARLQDDKILLVDPTSRLIVDVITDRPD